MVMGKSPRLTSLNSADDAAPADPAFGAANGPPQGSVIKDHLTGEENMNSSCKNTRKMNDRRLNGVQGDFSFFESVNREFGNANAANYNNN